jgi:hypothetical protein
VRPWRVAERAARRGERLRGQAAEEAQMSDACIDGASNAGLPSTLQYCFSSHPLNFGGVRYTPKTEPKKTETESVGFLFFCQPIGSFAKTEFFDHRNNRTEMSV